MAMKSTLWLLLLSLSSMVCGAAVKIKFVNEFKEGDEFRFLTTILSFGEPTSDSSDGDFTNEKSGFGCFGMNRYVKVAHTVHPKSSESLEVNFSSDSNGYRRLNGGEETFEWSSGAQKVCFLHGYWYYENIQNDEVYFHFLKGVESLKISDLLFIRAATRGKYLRSNFIIEKGEIDLELLSQEDYFIVLSNYIGFELDNKIAATE